MKDSEEVMKWLILTIPFETLLQPNPHDGQSLDEGSVLDIYLGIQLDQKKWFWQDNELVQE